MQWNEHFYQKLFVLCLQWQGKPVDDAVGGRGGKMGEGDGGRK